MNATLEIHRVYTDHPDQSRQVSALLALLKARSLKETTGVSLQALPVVSARTVQPDAGGPCV